VTVRAGSLAMTNADGTEGSAATEISSSTFSSGNAGDVLVVVAGAVTIDGNFTSSSSLGVAVNVSPTGINSQAGIGATGNAGSVVVQAGSLSIERSGEISSSTFGPGNAGTVAVSVDGLLAIDGSPGNTGATGIFSASAAGFLSDAAALTAGNAGNVDVTAGALTATNNGQISTLTAGSGTGGVIRVNVAGGLTLTQGSQIQSGTAGAGNGGTVLVTTGGPLSLSDAGTSIAASASAAGNAGSVSIVAPQITIADGASVASSAAGTGSGGDLTIAASGDILLSGAGPQVSASSTGSGNAGSITVSAANLQLADGASISTEAASANGGNITLSVGGLLYLLHSAVTTSVDGAKGNGGNILIDPQFVVLTDSQIIANAVGGNGGNITIITGEFVPSSNSIVSASSQLGIAGAIDIEAPRTALDKSLTTLPSELRGAAILERDKCAAATRSALVDLGRGGLPQDPDAAVPALYLARRGVGAAPAAARAAAGPGLAGGGSVFLASAGIGGGCR
jgi:large exoprotein involved in heme utilization and adhesion